MRISTKESNDKQSFNRQEKSLKAYAKDNSIEYLIDFGNLIMPPPLNITQACSLTLAKYIFNNLK